MKALYKWTDVYSVSFYRKSNMLIVDFDTKANESRDYYADKQQALNDLYFETIRRDVISQTSNLRELLVGRALYATCIEQNDVEQSEKSATLSSWREDAQAILSTWQEVDT